MSLKPKSAVLQIRLDPDLLELFQAQCADRHYTVSDVIRRMIIGRSEAWTLDAKKASDRENKARGLNPYGAAHTGPTPPDKTTPTPVKTLTRAQLKKQARLAQGRK